MEESLKLTSDNVEKIFLECLFKEGEPTEPIINIGGIKSNFGFHPERVSENEDKIVTLMKQLPKAFEGGWSFLNLCYDSEENLWTGSHQMCELLMVLCMAVGRMEYILPRELWDSFPGGMPYVRVVEKGV